MEKRLPVKSNYFEKSHYSKFSKVAMHVFFRIKSLAYPRGDNSLLVFVRSVEDGALQPSPNQAKFIEFHVHSGNFISKNAQFFIEVQYWKRDFKVIES